MPHAISRRSFVKTSTLASVGVLGGLGAIDALALPAKASPNELFTLSNQLAQQWLAALLKLQITDKARGDDYGGIRGPGDSAVPGRIGETIYPLLRQAQNTQQSQYLDAAQLLYRWTENRVSQPDGSWLNEPQPSAWKGTTVFMAIALAEALKNHGAVLDNAFKNALTARLLRAGNFIHDTFTINYGNINYPIAASYGLSLLGEVLDVARFRQKGHDFAHQALRFFSPANFLLFGEGTPYNQPSKKGCYSIDLGYNVEESLPSLVQYGRLTKDEEVLATVTHSLQAHLEFMLPDGAWDNSWGTRNYKWTYWGSRTSDGCPPAYALLASRDPRFYQAALRNTQLLQRCTTAAGLLAGGPHAAAHGLPTSVHHTFCHLKALTTVLDYSDAHQQPPARPVLLPREQPYGSRFFADIQTWLISQGPYRATVTAYDREYKAYRNGHASGGALTMLWHERAGILLAASMNEYQLYEAGNMASNTTPPVFCLTPRIELRIGEGLYLNISDVTATVTTTAGPSTSTLTARAKLVDKNQQNPPAGEVVCTVSYTISATKVVLDFAVEASPYDEQLRILLPLISPAAEPLTVVSAHTIRVMKGRVPVTVTANQPLTILPAAAERVFNFVPGLEAIPLSIEGRQARIELLVA